MDIYKKISFHPLESYTQISYEKLLKLIAKKIIGDIGGRIEPRALKKRANAYPLLMKPRKIAQQEVLKNGHPKKQ